MKTSVTVADGTFPTVTACLLGSYEKVAKEAAAIGYDALQITVNRPKEVPLKELLAALKKYKLNVSSIGTGLGNAVDGLSMGSSDEANRAAAVNRMKEHVDLALQLDGARVGIGIMRGFIKDAGSREIYVQQFRKSVSELLAYADEKAIDVIMEANDHTETDMYLAVKETADFVQSFNSERFKLQIDSIHMLKENQDVYTEVLRTAPLLAQVDISDENRMAPDGRHFDFPLLIKALKEANYNDYLVFEFRAEPPENAAKVGFDYIMKLLEQV